MSFKTKLFVLSLLQAIQTFALTSEGALFVRPKAVLSRPFIHPINAELRTILKDQSHLGLNTIKRLNFGLRLRKFLRTKITNPEVRVSQKKAALSLLGTHEAAKITSLTHRFYFGSYPICDHELKAHLGSHGETLVLGSFPEVAEDVGALYAEDWVSNHDALDLARQHFGMTQTPKLLSSYQCVAILDQKAHAVWQMVIEVKNLPFLVSVAQDRILEVSPRFFDGFKDVQISAWDPNPATGKIKNFTETIIDGTQLESTYFKTETGSASAATSDNGQFIYPKGDIHLDETSTFVHAIEHLKFFNALGYTWTQSHPLKLRIHDSDVAGLNNALYRPAGSTEDGFPAISIGDSDGILLQNLATDKDVVHHEFGHHTIFRTLTNTTGESLVIHEALADFFAFAASGDPCLGESICPSGSSICYCPESAKKTCYQSDGSHNPDMCLRTADNELQYNSSEWGNMGAHQRGQVISGMLWDVRSTVGADNLTKIVYSAVDMLSANSGFLDLFIALLFADKNLFNKQYGQTLYTAMVDRNFSSILGSLDYANEDTWQTSSGSKDGLTNNGSDGNGKTSTPTKRKTGCGSIGTSSDSSHHFTFLWLLLAPLGLRMLIRWRLSDF